MVFALFTAVSCRDDDPSLTAEYTGENVAASGGTATFDIKSNVEWTVANSDAWVTSISPATGQNNGSVTVTFAANPTAQERSSVFTATSGTLTATVTITQAAAGESLAVEYTAVDIPGAGGTAAFRVVATVSWTAATTSVWITEINPAQGTGNADVTVTVAPNDTANPRTGTVTVSSGSLPAQTIEITQVGATLPAAAGTITESDVTPTSVVLNIAAIDGAATYKWYKDNAEVQNTASRTYTATANGTYKVAGVNGIGEGPASPDHVVTLGGQMATLEDYLGDYVFNVTYMDINDESTAPGQYNDTMTRSTSDEYDLRFTNAIDQQNSTVLATNTYMDFNYDDATGKIGLFADYWYDYLGTQQYYMMFAPCVLDMVTGSIYFVFDIEVELNMATGAIAFPTELTSSGGEITAKAYYINWAWSYTTQESLGRYCEFFMTDVVATKTGNAPAPAGISSTGDSVIKISVKITPPPGFDPSVPVRANQTFVPR